MSEPVNPLNLLLQPELNNFLLISYCMKLGVDIKKFL